MSNGQEVLRKIQLHKGPWSGFQILDATPALGLASNDVKASGEVTAKEGASPVNAGLPSLPPPPRLPPPYSRESLCLK